MTPSSVAGLGAWITDAGLGGLSENDILRGFCEGLCAVGVPLARGTLVIDTLHPLHEGLAFRWRADGNSDGDMIELGRSVKGSDAYNSWLSSPFHHLRRTGGTMLRRRLFEDERNDFPIIPDLREQGQTDYLVLVREFAEGGSVGEMDCIHSSWTSAASEGFSEADVELMTGLFPALALALKCASLQRITGTLVETYLGRDAGRRVLAGRIERGVADRLRTALWFSDLRGFTNITDTAGADHVLPFLNDYAEAVISSIHEAGGDVLKLIGDGTLAIFSAEDAGEACHRALSAAALARDRLADVSARRLAEGLPATQAYLGLHYGEVHYGNIGSSDRLDFTVIGPAVNMASRIAAMCRSVERKILMSSAFVEAVPGEHRRDIVSVGRYALRGFDAAQELFTVVPPPAA